MNNKKGVAPPRYRHRIDENRSLWYRWNGIKKRCLNKNDERYHEYGGRGIKVCDEWLESFDNFADWALSHGYREDLTIERINVNGDYCPENCCWISRKEQAYNKCDTIWVDYKGRHIQLVKLCQEKGLRYDAIHNRIMAQGWDVEKAIDEPLHTNVGSLMSKCKERGLNYGTVRDRIVKLHWTEEEALGVPTGAGRGVNMYTRRSEHIKCEWCGDEFVKAMGRQRFCSAECRESAKKERRRKAC